ncbi:MAG: hypothetical protein AB7H80_17775 [Candidatus Kapaibacterium sp.]
MARTARSLIREANARKNGSGSIENFPLIADDGFRPQKVDMNPLSELIDDDTFAMLQSHGLFYEKALRDYQIRKTYREMRKQMPSVDAIEHLQQAYPYLQFDTIRKIIYAKIS